MATFIADEHGKVRITRQIDQGASVSFAITGDVGVAFTPGQTVDIDDARLERTICYLLGRTEQE